jgi:hypothetical protein
MMTTPQMTLQRIEYKISELIELLEGAIDEEGCRRDMYDFLKSVEDQSINSNKRLELLEDKMNLIIKLLSKDAKAN